MGNVWKHLLLYDYLTLNTIPGSESGLFRCITSYLQCRLLGPFIIAECDGLHLMGLETIQCISFTGTTDILLGMSHHVLLIKNKQLFILSLMPSYNTRMLLDASMSRVGYWKQCYRVSSIVAGISVDVFDRTSNGGGKTTVHHKSRSFL